MHRIIMIGPQGSGKNTQAELLAKKLGVPMVSTGDLWREEIAAKTELGQRADPIISKGNLVPDEWTNDLIRKRLSQPDVAGGFVLIGSPRTAVQGSDIDTHSTITHVIELKLSDEEAVERLRGRLVCKQAGHNYHVVHHPPKKEGLCVEDGSSLIVRHDDTLEAIRQRLKVYHTETEPLLDFYRPRGIVHEINGAQSIEKVHEDILNALGIR